MPQTDVSGLSMLGSHTETVANPEAAVLEKVPSGHAGTDYVVRFTAPEFTSLCPMTGQPDFAHIIIDYIPNEWLVESKEDGEVQIVETLKSLVDDDEDDEGDDED